MGAVVSIGYANHLRLKTFGSDWEDIFASSMTNEAQ